MLSLAGWLASPVESELAALCCNRERDRRLGYYPLSFEGEAQRKLRRKEKDERRKKVEILAKANHHTGCPFSSGAGASQRARVCLRPSPCDRCCVKYRAHAAHTISLTQPSASASIVLFPFILTLRGGGESDAGSSAHRVASLIKTNTCQQACRIHILYIRSEIPFRDGVHSLANNESALE